jgi:hypothetical protein
VPRAVHDDHQCCFHATATMDTTSSPRFDDLVLSWRQEARGLGPGCDRYLNSYGSYHFRDGTKAFADVSSLSLVYSSSCRFAFILDRLYWVILGIGVSSCTGLLGCSDVSDFIALLACWSPKAAVLSSLVPLVSNWA